MTKGLFVEGLEKNDQVILNKMTTELILKNVGSVSSTEGLLKGVLLDTETTGLDHSRDAVIEIAVREFYFDTSYNFKGFGDFYNGFNDPGFPIPAETTQITGITDTDVKGQKFDWNKINQICESSKVIIAHNAAFDCPFMKAQKEFTQKEIVWGCSMSQVPWAELGFKTRGLEVLAVFHGFYYTGHRALIDVDATGYLLSKSNYLSLLLTEAKRHMIRIKARGADFDSKDLLRANGYRWDAPNKFWWRDEPKEKIEIVKKWLQEEVYVTGKFTNCVLEEISIYNKFEG